MPTAHESLEGHEIPHDARLPGLSLLLDQERFLAFLRSQGNEKLEAVERCRITYIRYKPATNCLVAYELSDASGEHQILLYGKIYTDRDFGHAVLKAGQARWIEIPGLPAALPLPDERAILYFFPNDCLIGGLRLASEPKKIQRLLYEYHPKFTLTDWRISDSRLRLTVARYKPERRAVLRCQTKAINRQTGEKTRLAIYLRAYADDRGRDAYELQRKLYHDSAASGRLSVPGPIAYVPDRRLIMMEAVEGDLLLGRLEAGDSNAVVSAAAAIAELHVCDNGRLVARSFDSLLADAAASGEILYHVAPEEAVQVETILGLFGKYRGCYGRGRMGFVHGDFYHGQVILRGNCGVVIDFDRSYFGETCADLGNFSAHLRLMGLDGRLADPARPEENFLEAYASFTGKRPHQDSAQFFTAYGLFQLAVGPFRRLEQSWRQKTRVILDECQRTLQS